MSPPSPVNKFVDTRRYSMQRLLSFHGYDEAPVINDSLLFQIPHFRQHFGRIVSVDQKTFELWSPNSSQNAYISGVVPKEFNMDLPPDLLQRRYDGHLGKFDYTVNPQMASFNHLWRGFILRPSVGHARRDVLPEYILVHDEWQSLSSNSSPHAGRLKVALCNALEARYDSLLSEMTLSFGVASIQPDFWDLRPSALPRTEVTALRKINLYENAVDQVVQIQRHLREMSAWMVMARIFMEEGKTWRPTVLRRQGVSPGNDDYLGVWINGCKEDPVLWLLSHGVPCFIAHEIAPTDFVSKTASMSTIPDFWRNTDALRLRREANGYDRIGLRDSVGPFTFNYVVLRPPFPPMSSESRRNSSAAAQGWNGPVEGWSVIPDLPDDYSDDGSDDIPLAPRPTPSNPDHAAPLLDYVPQPEGQRSWLRPPPVAPRPSGKWSSWKYDDGEKQVVEVGKQKSKTLSGQPYYDRIRGRRIYFTYRPSAPPELTSDVAIFGLPAPRVPYIGIGDRARAPSHWLYPVENPDRRDVGRIVHPPVAPSIPTPSVEAAPRPVPPLGGSGTRLPSEEPPVSLGSTSSRSPSPSVKMDVDPVPSPYLRSDAFSLNISWSALVDSFSLVSQGLGDAQILRVVRTVTESRQTVWFATTSDATADVLRTALASSPSLPTVNYAWATLEEYQQAVSISDHSWSPPLPSVRPPSPDARPLRNRGYRGPSRRSRSPSPYWRPAPPPRRDTTRAESSRRPRRFSPPRRYSPDRFSHRLRSHSPVPYRRASRHWSPEPSARSSVRWSRSPFRRPLTQSMSSSSHIDSGAPVSRDVSPFMSRPTSSLPTHPTIAYPVPPVLPTYTRPPSATLPTDVFPPPMFPGMPPTLPTEMPPLHPAQTQSSAAFAAAYYSQLAHYYLTAAATGQAVNTPAVAAPPTFPTLSPPSVEVSPPPPRALQD
ncbi:hypothetical protein Hypma_005857 [Hypsizygus marmoreus]|uniref:Uncharacterized protein n=1 Tax=Hypsizygus marmoreus TaxID=39966 RepID=A0A369KD54_HYPMA|nr:hypothetical protein Hypma_005857 [Hypsizygus marmoreus]